LSRKVCSVVAYLGDARVVGWPRGFGGGPEQEEDGEGPGGCGEEACVRACGASAEEGVAGGVGLEQVALDGPAAVGDAEEEGFAPVEGGVKPTAHQREPVRQRERHMSRAKRPIWARPERVSPGLPLWLAMKRQARRAAAVQKPRVRRCLALNTVL
jgi:hypothetical protein